MTREDLQTYDLPDRPGVYIFRGPRKEMLYVGKATSLRDRVRSYFSTDLVNARGERIVAMVERANNLTWQETGSVLEALIVEANLIKHHQPPYNVDEKDDKSWNYVVITKENFPRVLTVRGRDLLTSNQQPATGNQFGPFPQGGQLKEAMKIVRKIFPYRDTCTPCELWKVRPSRKSEAVQSQKMSTTTLEGQTFQKCRPCFNRQIGLCPGVCSGEVGKTEYARMVRHIVQLFSGNMKGLKRRLGIEMNRAAKAERFEEAAILRRQIAALDHIRDVSLIKDENRSAYGHRAHGAHARIEAFDTAHTAGAETVAVMTVVQDGDADKSAYRKFTIRTATNDDVAALKEALSRRLGHAEWPLPRVFAVDGGAAQVRAAQSILKKIGVMIPVVGVVKNEAHKPERLIGDTKMIRQYEREILLANAEAHRFAIQWHRKRLRRRVI